MPAKRGNKNAIGGGLWSAHPAVRLPKLAMMPETVTLGQMAEWAAALGDSALTISEDLRDAVKASQAPVDDDAATLIVLYAEVGHEMHQLAAEVAGEAGIKPAALGNLGRGAMEVLIKNQARGLELVLGQCMSATATIEAWKALGGPGEGVLKNGAINPVLRYLAGYIRAAKRMLRQFAANRIWQTANEGGHGDLIARVMAGIKQEE